MKNLQPPIAIITTFSGEMIKINGGPYGFMRSFLKCMNDQERWWMHRSKNRPQHDVLYVYIIIAGHLRYRVNYGGYETGDAQIKRYGRLWTITWPRMILTGPLIKAPEKIKMQGFQGFRYTYTELF